MTDVLSLQEQRPPFFALLDSDPDEAWAQFHAFAWELFRQYPPPAFRDLPNELQEDLVSDLILRCCQDDFSVLRRFESRGVPFSFWLSRMARNKAIDVLRREGRQASEILIPVHAAFVDRVDYRELLAIVDECLEEMDGDKQEMLRFAAAEYRPREIAAEVGLPPSAGKKISDKVRECRKELRRRLGW